MIGNIVLIIGVLSSIANAVVFMDNDPAFWGWASSAMWAFGLLIRELFSNK